MATLKAQKLGGQKMAAVQREQALARYYADPNHCLHCGEVIPVSEKQTVSETRKRKFCNQSCGATFNNLKSPKRVKTVKEPKTKQSRPKLPSELIGSKTKGELFQSRKNYQSARTAIVKHATRVFEQSPKPKACAICGYFVCYEIAHVKAVSDFDDSILVSEINHIDNLVALCPNHHVEFDKGLRGLDLNQ